MGKSGSSTCRCRPLTPTCKINCCSNSALASTPTRRRCLDRKARALCSCPPLRSKGKPSGNRTNPVQILSGNKTTHTGATWRACHLLAPPPSPLTEGRASLEPQTNRSYCCNPNADKHARPKGDTLTSRDHSGKIDVQQQISSSNRRQATSPSLDGPISHTDALPGRHKRKHSGHVCCANLHRRNAGTNALLLLVASVHLDPSTP